MDFYLHAKKIIIEIDGGQHNSESAKNSDLIRDKYFKNQGYTVRPVQMIPDP